MYSMRFNTCLLMILFGYSVSLFAQEIYPLTLDNLFRLGTENSLKLQAGRLQETISAERVKTAQASRLPEINIGATAGYIGQPTLFRQGFKGTAHPDTPDWSHNYNVELTQPIYRGGKIHHSIRKAQLEKERSGSVYKDDRAEIKITLLRRYLDLFSLYKQKELFQRNIEESGIRLKDIRRMRKEGLVTRNDEIRSELQLTNDELSLRETENTISIVSQQLDVVLGLDESLLLLPDTVLLNEPVSLQQLEDYLQSAYVHFPGLKIARYNTQLARSDVKLVKADYLPSVSLHTGNTLSRPVSSSMEDLFINNWNIALSLSYNLSSLYRNKHKVQEAIGNVSLYKNAEEQVIQEIRINVRSAFLRHNEALERVRSLRLSVRQAEENYRIVNNRYLNQLSILTDLLDASNVRLVAELQLTAARAETIFTYYQLLRACGNL